MNEHDTLKMYGLLAKDGYTPTDSADGADLILFNTCTVREKSHHKAISEVGKALKGKGQGTKPIIGIVGCVAQEEEGRLFETFPDLDIVLGPDQIYRLPELVRTVRRSQSSIRSTELINNHEDYNFVIDTAPSAGSLRPVQPVTIIKGCNNFCTFCIVPFVRGREVSKTPDDIIKEIKNYCNAGVREAMLLGQNVNSYGKDNRAFGNFAKLLGRIAAETELLRIRYTSPHPKDLSDELIMQHQTNSKLCEHIHLPVQSGSTNVLKRMNRNYTRADFLEKISRLKKAVPDIAITTDLIVGFPGETEDDFADTLSLMEEVCFDGMFAFKYSVRSGTKAALKFKDDVSVADKKARLAQVLELNQRIVLQKHEKYVGSKQQVLVEGASPRGKGQLSGRTRTNKIVNFDGDKTLVGKLVDVNITWAGPNTLRGIIQ